MRLACAAAVVVASWGLVPLWAAEVHWQGVARAAQSYLPEQPAGEKPALDALEARVRDALGRLEHPSERRRWEQSVPKLRQNLTTAVGIDRLPKPQAGNIRVVGTIDHAFHHSPLTHQNGC